MSRNALINELHAIVGVAQLRRLPEFIGARRRVAQVYDQALSRSEWFAPQAALPQSRSNYYKYVAFPRRAVDRAALKLAWLTIGATTDRRQR